MICTDSFVYVHEPKTGGTFVSTVLDRIHKLRPTQTAFSKFKKRLGFPAQMQSRYGSYIHYQGKLKHATCSEIPNKHAGKNILASIRNPFDLYVSEYHFGWRLGKNIVILT